MFGEGMAAVAIAVSTGLCVAGSQLHKRITTLDNRLDGIELKIVSAATSCPISSSKTCGLYFNASTLEFLFILLEETRT